jgi:hypothetical protein
MTATQLKAVPAAYEIATGIPLPSRVPGLPDSVGPITAALRKLAAAPIGASVFIPGKGPKMLGHLQSASAGGQWLG